MAVRQEEIISKIIIDGSAAEAGTKRVSMSLNVMANALNTTLAALDPMVKATLQYGRENVRIEGQIKNVTAAIAKQGEASFSQETALKLLADRSAVLAEMQKRLESGTLTLAQAQGALSGKFKSVEDFVKSGNRAYLEFMATMDKGVASQLAAVQASDKFAKQQAELREILKGTTLSIQDQEIALKKLADNQLRSSFINTVAADMQKAAKSFAGIKDFVPLLKEVQDEYVNFWKTVDDGILAAAANMAGASQKAVNAALGVQEFHAVAPELRKNYQNFWKEVEQDQIAVATRLAGRAQKIVNEATGVRYLGELAPEVVSEYQGLWTELLGGKEAADAKIVASEKTKADALTRERERLKAAMLGEVDAVVKAEKGKAEAYKRVLAEVDPLQAIEQRRAKLTTELTEGAKAAGKSQADLAKDISLVNKTMDEHKKVVEESIKRQNQLAAAGGMSRNSMLMLNASVINTVQSLSAGLPVTMVMMQQIPQVAGAFLQESSALGKVTTAVSGFVTANTALVGGIAGLTAGLVVALVAQGKYAASVRELEQNQKLLGNRLGLSIDQMFNLADAAAEAGRVSSATARAMVSAYSSAGIAGTDNIKNLIELTRDYATVTGTDAAEATKSLAAMFKDPAAGAQELTQKINLLSGAELSRINLLAASGDKQAAQVELIKKLSDRIKDAAENTSNWAKAWEAMGRGKDAVLEFIGGGVNLLANGPTLKEQIDALTSKGLDDKSAAELLGFTDKTRDAQRKLLADLRTQYLEHLRALALQSKTVAENAASVSADVIAKTFDPILDQIEQADAKLKALQKGLATGRTTSSMDVAGAVAATEQQKAELAYLAALGKGLDAATVKNGLLAEAKMRAAKAGNTPTAQKQLAQESAWINGLGSGTKDPNHAQAQANATLEFLAQQTGAINQQNMALAVQAKGVAASASAWGSYTDGLMAYPEAMARAAEADARSKAETEALTLAIDVAQRTRGLLSENALKQLAASKQTVAGMELEAINQEKITAATKLGVDARRLAQQEADIYKAQAPILAAAVQAETAGNKALGDELRRVAAAYRDKAVAANDDKFKDSLAQTEERYKHEKELLTERAKLVGAPVQTKAMVQAQREVTELLYGQGRQYEKLNAEEKKRVDGLVKQKKEIAEQTLTVERQEKAWEELSQIGERAFERIGDALVDVFVSGKKEALDWGNITKGIIASLISDLVKMAAIRPLQNAMFGGNQPTLWDAVGKAGQTGQGSSFGAADLASLGQTGYSIYTGSNTLGTLANSFALSSAGQGLGLSTAGFVDTIGAVQIANAPALTGAGASFTSGLGTIGSAAPYGMLGGMAGSYLGNNVFGGSKVAGALSGAAIGAGSAYVGANMLGLGASLGPWGLVAAAVIAAVMAAIGTQKPSTMHSGAYTDSTSGGIVTNRASGGKDGTDVEGIASTTDGVAKIVNTVIQSGKLTQLGNLWVGVENSTNKGTLTKLGGWGGVEVSKATDPRKMAIDVLNYLTANNTQRAGVPTVSGNEMLIRGLRNMTNRPADEIEKDIALALNMANAKTALDELDTSLDGITKSAKTARLDALKPMLDDFQRAQELKLGDDFKGLITGQFNAMAELAENPREYSELESNLAKVRGEFSALREVAVKIDPALGSIIDRLEKAEFNKLATEANKTADYAINEASGRSSLNTVNQLIWDRQKNAATFTALGQGTGKADQLFFAELNKFLKGLDSAGLNQVINAFEGEVDDLARAFLATAEATEAATRAQEDAAKAVERAKVLRGANVDMWGRQQALLGNTRGQSLMNFDLQASQQIENLLGSGVDVSLLKQIQANERSKLDFDIRKADLLEGIDREIRARQDQVTVIQNTTLKMAQLAKQFKDAYDELALSDGAPNSPESRLTEVRQQWNAALATTLNSNATEKAKEEAKQKLLELGSTRIDIAREFFASSNDSDYREVREVFKQLGLDSGQSLDKVETQIDLLQNQIDEYQKLRTSTERLGERTLGSLDDLKSALYGAKATLDAQLAQLAVMPVPQVNVMVNGSQVTTGTFGTTTNILTPEQKYYQAYADVAAEGANAAQHYALFGKREGRQDFGLTFTQDQRYLVNNPDVAAAVVAGQFTSGRQHYDLFGQFEGRTYAKGGIVGNGIWNQDSVMAEFAGGGAIAVAGGEHITQANSVNAATYPVLDYINRKGEVPRVSNGAATGVIESQLANANQQIGQLTRTVEHLCRVIQDGEMKNVQATMAGNSQLSSMASASIRQGAKRRAS